MSYLIFWANLATPTFLIKPLLKQAFLAAKIAV